MLVLKHLHDWSFDECEQDVRGSLVYRAFSRIDGERVRDAKTLIRLAHVLDEPVLKNLLARLLALGRARGGSSPMRSSCATRSTRKPRAPDWEDPATCFSRGPRQGFSVLRHYGSELTQKLSGGPTICGLG
jgi:hypothetical protein